MVDGKLGCDARHARRREKCLQMINIRKTNVATILIVIMLVHNHIVKITIRKTIVAKILIMLVHIVKITNVIRIPCVAHNAIKSKVEKCHKDCREAEGTGKLQHDHTLTTGSLNRHSFELCCCFVTK